MDPALRDEYLELMGLYAWARRVPGEAGAAQDALSGPSVKTGSESPSAPARRADTAVDKPSPAAGEPSPAQSPIATLDWDALSQRVAQCTACRLHERRTQTVFGVGARNAPVMFIGEGPGEQEDLQGEAFVGAAGQLLDNMLAAIGRSRQADVYIANVVKCRPPGNRKPSADEADACGDYLDRQIELVAPKLLVALGGVAATRLLGQESPVGKLRGQIHDYRGRPLVVTYHPAYYLRSPSEKRKGWDDLKRIRALLEQ